MKTLTYGFGVDPAQSENHFYVWVPSGESGTTPPTPQDCNFTIPIRLVDGQPLVQIFERYSWTVEGEQTIDPADKLRLDISKHKWSKVKDALSTEYNARLKKDGLKAGKFASNGGTPVERLFGKEMMVLLWAIEDCDPSAISTAVRNWKGLLPEERWWLYTMTNAATGERYDKKGWRKALRFALCENPVVERQQMSLFDGIEGLKI